MDFLDQIPTDALALASFKSQAYSRALLHLEAHCSKHPEKLKSNLSFLQSIYVELGEPDGVAGVAAIRQEEPSLKEQIIEYEATGRLHDALGCYERLCIAQETGEIYEGMLKCYLNLGQPQSVLNIAHGLISRKCDLGGPLHEYRVEAAWRLGQWSELESLLNSSESLKGFSWGEGVGKAFLAARERNSKAYQKAMRDLRIQQITPLSAASMEKSAYQRAYPSILRLQILNEMDEMLLSVLKVPLNITDEERQEQHAIDNTPTESSSLSLSELHERWNQRFSMLQMSYRFLEPLLNFRRTLLGFGRDWMKETNQDESQKFSEELKKNWLKSAKVARKAGYLQQAELAFYGAAQGRDVFVEKAKLHWAKGEQTQAVSVLTRGLDKFFPEIELLKKNIGVEHENQRESCARAKLLLAQYSEESATLDVSIIKDYYRDVCEINKPWEDGHFNLAMYYDRILTSLDVKAKPVEWLNHIVLSFGKSLNYGCRYLYQSMPRLLSIWLDLGAKVAEMESAKRNHATLASHKDKLNVMNSFLTQLLDRLPLYMFLIALPQLISRICHSNKGVFEVLSKIIATMLIKYRQQSMWHLIAVSKSSYQTRLERCLHIFNLAKKGDPSLGKFIADATKLADLFIDLCDKHVEKGVSSMKLDSFMRALPRLLSDPKFSNIILPFQSQMNVTLPTLSTNLKNLHSHNPFQRKEIYIKGIEDEVEIMSSLVQPKKVTLIGSDGKKYIMMCKPKDDMRKDCRLMEFNSLINKLLMQDPETRKRDLKIRTYMVVPLNEECGLIEWIPNLCGLRHILHKLYKENGFYTSGQELKSLMCSIEDSLQKKKEVFLHRFMPKHPPIFYKWFLLTFVDPQAWMRARLSYCRTTAVMSMIGYIVGLGDRHGENILFDSVSGDTVHVDFNCLFNKGEKFDWPERVPFRLTHNMVSAMGPTGVEGVYRKTCEVTMRVMRDKRDELMSVLKPFIYDPLVEWEKKNERRLDGMKGATVKGTGEICNEKAQSLVKAIEERLSGQIRSDSRGVHLPLSVEGQVNVLIKDATSVDNLCQMYIGWAPYM
ncbi:Serine/threonine-protein kinase ATR [Armadillidium vulgare]|nr:Serine/threonine-protein kinase ATR [Armadillidium vulgare]